MGWLGFVFVGGGALSIWSGFQGVKLLDVLRSVLTGTPMPAKPGAKADPVQPGSGPGSGGSGTGGGIPIRPDGSAPTGGGYPANPTGPAAPAPGAVAPGAGYPATGSS